MTLKRYLAVVADDYGVGPATSQGILDLAVQGLLTGTVFLVNSPYAEQAAAAWHRAGRPLELGWHPCLTMDGPVLPAGRVPSLVDGQGRFLSVAGFLGRLYRGAVRVEEIRLELAAQYTRFCDLAGQAPAMLNFHKHLQIFPPVGAILRTVLAGRGRLPYVRRVREPWQLLAQVPGARVKRAVLSLLGRREARCCRRAGFPGNDWLIGITDPPWVGDPDFLVRWLNHVPGWAVELMCHPGHLDATLAGRDCPPGPGVERRPREFQLLRLPSFREACRRARFTLMAPSAMMRQTQGGGRSHAA
jgi:predicted glycoside hydrolase/deacetylase ChbG (UPF0249 family)